MSNVPQGKPRTSRMAASTRPKGPTRLSAPVERVASGNPIPAAELLATDPVTAIIDADITADSGDAANGLAAAERAERAARADAVMADQRLILLFLGALGVMAIGLSALLVTTLLPLALATPASY